VFDVFQMTRQAGLISIAYMMIGCPHEKSPGEILQVKRFIRDLDPDYVVYSLFTPYPDTKIFQEGIRLGLWDPDIWIKFIRDPQPGMTLPTMWTQHLDAETLLQLFKEVNRDFYFQPKVLARTLKNLKGPAHLARILRGGISIARLQFMKPKSHRI